MGSRPNSLQSDALNAIGDFFEHNPRILVTVNFLGFKVSEECFDFGKDDVIIKYSLSNITSLLQNLLDPFQHIG